MMKAFSLVELSIVLVILGLLTGGILAGQSLIRASELRSIVTDLQSHATAAKTFQNKYMALPGDMRNATAFWGEVIAGGSCATTNVGSGTQTCNGNGDGRLQASGANGQYGEIFTFWQHLANAGLISGTYTGRADAGGTKTLIFGTNVPNSRISNGAWTSLFWDNVGGTSGWTFSLYYGNFFGLGSVSSGVDGDGNAGPLLKPEEAWSIDTKIDDGMPATGTMIGRRIADCTTAVAPIYNDFASSYNLTRTSQSCSLMFRNMY